MEVGTQNVSFIFDAFQVNYANCPITMYQITETQNGSPSAPKNISDPDLTGLSTGQVTLQGLNTRYYIYADDDLNKGKREFYLIVTALEGLQTTFGPYTLNLTCGMSSSNMISTTMSDYLHLWAG